MKLNIQKIMGWALILMMGAWSCQDNTNQAKSSEVAMEVTQPATENSNCYAYQEGGDTIQVKLTEAADGSIQGYMLFQLKEKDKNTGTFTGVKEGNLILADYSFQSEGVTSIRQIAFQQTDSTLKEGYGEIIQEGNQQRFKDPKQLDYQHSMVLKKIDCAALDTLETADH